MPSALPAQLVRGPAITPFRAIAEAGAEVVVTTREGGVSRGRHASLNLGLHVGDDPAAVLANRRLALATFGPGVALDDAVFCRQSHQARVATVGAAERGRGARTDDDALPDTDAMLTTEPGVVLAVLVADCVPVVLLDPVRRALAVVHAGWRGTVAGVTGAAVSALVAGGSDARHLLAGIGPSIAPDRYQVGDDVRAAAAQAFGDDADRVVRPDASAPESSAPESPAPESSSGRRWTFDLWQANRLQLLRAGVTGANIDVTGLGTGPGTPFYSHRFEATPGSPCGRFGLLARLPTS